MNTINSLGFRPIVPPTIEPAAGSSGGTFQKALDDVRNVMNTADRDVADAMVGDGSIHGAMISMTKADLSFRLMTQVRGKAIEAYRQMMNLQF